MNTFKLLKLKKLWHKCSEAVVSFDLRKTPSEIKKGIPKEEYETALQLPIIPAGDGLLLVNEAFSEWQTVRDLLVALDTLPHSMLEDIYKMEKKRYPTKESASISEDCTSGEKGRRILFMLMPELLKAQRKNHL